MQHWIGWIFACFVLRVDWILFVVKSRLRQQNSPEVINVEQHVNGPFDELEAESLCLTTSTAMINGFIGAHLTTNGVNNYFWVSMGKFSP